jgi:Fe-S oxidoreductase
MNPGKIVAPTRMDDRSLFRFKPGYRTLTVETGLDWSRHEVGEHNRGRGFAAAVEMCNNNGHCRKFDAGSMCPSYRVTRNERDLTRGRANSLRLALSGQLGSDALMSEDMYRTMELCVSCKGCKRECPTGVDMAAMKIEFLHQYYRRRRRPLKDRLVANLPRYAPTLSRYPGLANLRDRVPGLATLSEKITGLSARRSLPVWRRDVFRGQSEVPTGGRGNSGPEVVLLADTFNRYFEPGNLRAATKVLAAAGYRTIVPEPIDGGRPLCCGRTYLASGMIDEARSEARRVLDSLQPFVAAGIPVVGLEPSCLLGMRDEFKTLLPGRETAALANLALTFDEFLMRENSDGRLQLDLQPTRFRRALVHGHCHEKAFDVMPSVTGLLGLVPDLEVEEIPSGCCGMAGAFGYDAKTIDISQQMAEASLLPAVRAADIDTVIIADGTSCRHQILDLADHEVCHAARLLAESLI